MPKNLKGVAFSRHSERSDPGMGRVEEEKVEDFGGLSKQGAEKAREIAHQEYREMIDTAKQGTIVFIGGASEERRTKTTAKLIGKELSEIYKDSNDVLVYTKGEKEAKRLTLAKVKQIIEGNPEKKIVFDFPFYLREFSLRPHHRDKKTGKHTPYMDTLIKQKKGEQDEGREAAREWFRNKGRIETEDGTVLEAPSPQQTAETHIKGIERLRSFASQFTGNRPLEIGIVGHGWQLDALAVYLANKGEVTSEAFEELFEGKIMEQPETGKVTITEDKASLQYRGNSYEVPQALLEPKEEEKES